MNEKKIWDYLLRQIGNPYGAAGLMGNLYAESALNPKNLQGSYEKSLGMTDDQYTAAVDEGSYTDFVTDKAGYGLAQWTYHTRKAALLSFAQAGSLSIGNLDMQLAFLIDELQADFWSVFNTLLNARSVREASDAVLLKFEKPKDQSEAAQERRASYGQKYYDKYAEGIPMNELIQRVIDLATSEVGYLEKASSANLDDKTANAGKNNYTKYARDMDAAKGYFNGGKQAVAWCAVFVNWLFYQLFGMNAKQMLFQPETGNCAAGCGSARGYFNKNGHLFDAPEPGDQIFFWSQGKTSVSHTGLVVGADSERVYTVEGNTSDGTSVIANGGAVCAKSYPLGYQRIAGYGRPDWTKATGQASEPAPAEPAAEPALYDATATNPGKYLNLRTGKGTAYESICQIPQGATVSVLEDSDPDWWKVTYSGFTGYAMRKYLTPVERTQPEPAATVTVSRDRLLSLKALLVPFIHDAQILLEQVDEALKEGGG